MAAKTRHAGTMKDKRKKRIKEQKDLTEEISSFACPFCGYENLETDTCCEGCEQKGT